MYDADVVVVGGGISGLCTARALGQQGVSAVVLEARDRVGGRTWSQDFGAQGGRFDVGGQWVGPTQHQVRRLARELNLSLFPTYAHGRKVMDILGRRSTWSGDIPSVSWWSLLETQALLTGVNTLARRVDPRKPHLAKGALAWDRTTVDAWKRRFVRTKASRALIDIAVRSVFSVEPWEMSMLYFLAYISAAGSLDELISIKGGAQQDRFVLGAQSLSLAMARQLGDKVVLKAPARRIEQDDSGVVVHTDDDSWRGRYAVLAIPPAVSGLLEYRPGLPSRRTQFVQRAPMGATIKCLIFYNKAFWRDKGYSGESISDQGALAFTIDNSGPDGAQPCLVGFIAGDQARRWSGRPAPVRQRAVLDALAGMFGPEARHPCDYKELDWMAQPWSLGAPVGVCAPGALTGCEDALREPVGRIHWAGTETADRWTGYMDGAVQAGERAADEILRRL